MAYKLYTTEFEGVPVQYVGVYVLRWRPEWGEPQVAFAEDDSAEKQLATARARTRQVIEIARKWRGEADAAFVARFVDADYRRAEKLQAERDALAAENEALKARVDTLQFALREIATGPFTARGMRVIALNNCGPLTRYPVNDPTHDGGGLTPLSADDAAAHDPNAGNNWPDWFSPLQFIDSMHDGAPANDPTTAQVIEGLMITYSATEEAARAWIDQWVTWEG